MYLSQSLLLCVPTPVPRRLVRVQTLSSEFFRQARQPASSCLMNQATDRSRTDRRSTDQ